MDEAGPSSTDKASDIVQLWRQMDERLERKARTHNLSAVNVRSILHHLLKNPGVMSLVMGIDDEATLPELKLTRSKVKHFKKQTNKGMQPSTEPVAVPRAGRTFLDVHYDNDDDDEDYFPELDETAVCSQTDTDHVSTHTIQDQPSSHTRSHNLEGVEEALCGDDVLLFSAVDDPDYMQFINAINDPFAAPEDDEAEDPEYNFMCDVDCEQTPERDELRMDRATEIPMREVENLLQDLFESGMTNDLNLAQPVPSQTNTRTVCTKQPSTQQRGRRVWQDKFSEHLTVLMGASIEDLCSISLDSACLEGDSACFTPSERTQLDIQLRKHVQLLTQFVVGSRWEASLLQYTNQYQSMINELVLLADSNCVLRCCNLHASLATCHDANSAGTVLTHPPQHSSKFEPPLPPTMAVLARSRALLYPELMPTRRLRQHSSYYQYFTAPEDNLLAMGQSMFSHVPHSNAVRRDGRNCLIVRHFLPTKEVSQIRLHMKNFRLSTLPIYSVIARAEQGMVTMLFPPERDHKRDTPPYAWPEHCQPGWLKMLDKEVFLRDPPPANTPLACEEVSPDGVLVRALPCTPVQDVSQNTVCAAVSAQCSSTDQHTHPLPPLAASCQLILLPDLNYVLFTQPQHTTTGSLKAPVLSSSCVQESMPCSSQHHSIEIQCQEAMLEHMPHIDPRACVYSTDACASPSSAEPSPVSDKVLGPLENSRVSDDSNSGLTDLFSGGEVLQRTPPPLTPSFPHSPLPLLDDSASKSRLTDGDTSRCDWKQEGWTPLTPGRDMGCEADGSMSLNKATRSLFSPSHEVSVCWEAQSYAVKTKQRNNKKRTRAQRLRAGARGLLDERHRQRQRRALSRVLLDDFKQRMFMHQHKVQAISCLINQPPSIEMFQALRDVLGKEHDLLMVLVSLLFPEHLLPARTLHDPLRKAYAHAIDMIFNIEAYAAFGCTKLSARSMFRSIRELGVLCSSEEVQGRLEEMLGTEHPLWTVLSPRLPCSAHRSSHQAFEYECIDAASFDPCDALFEHIDTSVVLDRDLDRRRKPAVICNGKLLVDKRGKLCEVVACFKCRRSVQHEKDTDAMPLHSALVQDNNHKPQQGAGVTDTLHHPHDSHAPTTSPLKRMTQTPCVAAKRPKPSPARREGQLLDDPATPCSNQTKPVRKWQREDDSMLLHTYNQCDGHLDRVLPACAQALGISESLVSTRLSFLLSLFN